MSKVKIVGQSFILSVSLFVTCNLTPVLSYSSPSSVAATIRCGSSQVPASKTQTSATPAHSWRLFTSLEVDLCSYCAILTDENRRGVSSWISRHGMFALSCMCACICMSGTAKRGWAGIILLLGFRRCAFQGGVHPPNITSVHYMHIPVPMGSGASPIRAGKSASGRSADSGRVRDGLRHGPTPQACPGLGTSTPGRCSASAVFVVKCE